MKLEIIAHTPNPDAVVAKAGKICYSPVGIEEISKRLTKEEIERFVNMLVSIKHESPLEHVSFTFAVEGISRACSHQIVRHRIASFSQQSQRYVKLEQFDYIIPEDIKQSSYLTKIYKKAMQDDQRTYNELVDELMYEYLFDGKYENYLHKQVVKCKLVNEDFYEWLDSVYDSGDWYDELEVKYRSLFSILEKRAIENARYVFPNACETKMVFTMNGRSLINFLKHRECERAQDEVRNLAKTMHKELYKVAPILFGSIGPGCVNGKCTEGRMTCGNPIKIEDIIGGK